MIKLIEMPYVYIYKRYISYDKKIKKMQFIFTMYARFT